VADEGQAGRGSGGRHSGGRFGDDQPQAPAGPVSVSPGLPPAYVQGERRALLRVTEVISVISLGLAVALTVTLRFVWRRGKPLQEP
jgi:hypothetical protein